MRQFGDPPSELGHATGRASQNQLVPNPKFAERINMPPRPLEGLFGRSARRFCRAKHGSMPQKSVEWRLRRSAIIGLVVVDGKGSVISHASLFTKKTAHASLSPIHYSSVRARNLTADADWHKKDTWGILSTLINTDSIIFVQLEDTVDRLAEMAGNLKGQDG